ncbi:MAG TPA: NAD-dependent epimerase/dehydratase family protein [Pseudonocardiaceae bacterium]|jgi:nucleoside-diphosphate-sugar epimerase|nr:NAD-dependent epimerase/dehydratase family protein [Pseudonocardiaceae bacterium]
MRLLVLGGTAFVGRTVAAEAITRGHDVTCAARGESGAVPDGATLVKIDRDAADGLAALAGAEFDAVVDVATISYPWVAAALAELAGRVGHWTFVSTINVYSDDATPGQRPGAPLLEPLAEGGRGEGIVDPGRYGAIKVASENAVRDAFGDRSFVVRPGLITGPGDESDRFGYWPARFARGGRVLVPDVPDQPIQHVDVRDLAAWIVDAGEKGLGGTYDGVGPAGPLPDLLRDVAAAVGVDTEFVPVAPRALVDAGVTPWGGPKSLPLWAPSTHWGVPSHDATPSIEAGLRLRPLAETVDAALATERELGVDRERKAGLSAAEEAEVLAKLST